MKRFASAVLGIVTIVCFLVATERKAWGYVDPGAGLLAIQGVASLLGTIAYYFRRRLRGMFGSKTVEGPATGVVKVESASQNSR